jgi:hypothetical protein
VQNSLIKAQLVGLGTASIFLAVCETILIDQQKSKKTMDTNRCALFEHTD